MSALLPFLAGVMVGATAWPISLIIDQRKQKDSWRVRSPGATASGKVRPRKSEGSRVSRARIHTRG